MKTEELATAYREFFKGALGQDLLSRIAKIRSDQIDKAVSEGTIEPLNKAAGVDLVRAEIKRIQSLDRKGAGRQ